jgi:hypothetical protein
VNQIGGEPDQVPGMQVSSRPTLGTPAIHGRVRLRTRERTTRISTLSDELAPDVSACDTVTT